MEVTWGHEAAGEIELGGILRGEPWGEDGTGDETQEEDDSEGGEGLGADAEANGGQPAFALLFFRHKNSIACKGSPMQARVR
jgi:hypothetical protein